MLQILRPSQSNSAPASPLSVGQPSVGAQNSNKPKTPTKRTSARQAYAAAVRTWRSGLLAVAIISCIANCFVFVSPIFAIQVYDRVLMNQSVETLLGLLAIVLVLHFFSNIIRALRREALFAIADEIEDDLESHVISVAAQSHAEGCNAAVEDPIKSLDDLRAFLIGPAGITVFMDLPWALVFTIALGFFHPSLAVLAVVTFLLLSVIAWRLSSLQAQLEAGARATRRGLANIQGYFGTAVRARGLTGTSKTKWLDLRKYARESGRRDEQVGQVYRAATDFLQASSSSAMMALAAYLTIQQLTTAGVIIASGFLLRSILQTSTTLPAAIINWRKSTLAWQRLREGFEKLWSTKRAASKLNRADGVNVRIRGLSFRFPNDTKVALAEISFSINPGTVLAIVGKSGAGKSTLCKVLTGAFAPTAGRVQIAGLPSAKLSHSGATGLIGYLSENADLIGGTIAENISSFEPQPDHDKVRSVAQRFEIDSQIIELEEGYDTIVGATSTLPRGLRQRIALASAFYRDPPVLVLDHPMAYCTDRCKQAVKDEVSRLKSQRKIVVLVAYTEEELGMADVVLTLEHGRLIRLGPRSTLAWEGVGKSCLEIASGA